MKKTIRLFKSSLDGEWTTDYEPTQDKTLEQIESYIQEMIRTTVWQTWLIETIYEKQ